MPHVKNLSDYDRNDITILSPFQGRGQEDDDTGIVHHSSNVYYRRSCDNV